MTEARCTCKTFSNAESHRMDHEWRLLSCGVGKDVLSVKSRGKIIESGFTFSFDDYKCHMHKGSLRVEIFRKGRIFVLKMRRRWLESKAQIAAPIDEVADEEMEVDDDGEGAGDARAEPRDEPGGDPPPRPREVTTKSNYDQEQKLCANTI